jgi:glycerophosphoryl diester phosphodiesterase
MKKLALFLLGIAAASCGRQVSDVAIIAHRGYWNVAGSAQNSLAALQNAINLGCYGSELDVQVTADGVPVVFHDNTTPGGLNIQRSTYNTLIMSDETLSNGEQIPTLAQYLFAWNHSSTKLILELKKHADAKADARAVGAVLDILRAYGATSSEVEFISFSRHAVRALADSDFGAPVAYLEGDMSPAEAKNIGATGIDYSMEVLKANREWIAEAHDLGMKVNVWTVTTEAEALEFAKAGVDYITTDIPDLLVK